jgi:tRNA-modifying protein YgfZ
MIAVRPLPGRDNAPMTTSSVPQPSPNLPTNGCAQLSDWGVARASGADAVTFLHSQLTHDVALLGEGGARYAAFCNAQGRMLANMVLWKQGSEVWLAMPRSVMEATLKRLRMFVMRAKCTLEDLSDSVGVWGVWGDEASQHTSAVWTTAMVNDVTWVRLPDAHVHAVAGALAHTETRAGVPRALVIAPEAPASIDASAAQWAWLDVSAALPWVTPETVGQLVPQMVNMESLDGVSFKKGCYPGQEVVARSQFRGAIKRRGERVHSAQPMRAGDDVFAGDQAVGVVVNAEASPRGGWDALVSMHLGQAEGQTLRAGAADGDILQRWGLPYALREDI